jgi:hypothetical protein
MKVTAHGEDRIIERVGGKKKNAQKIAEKAYQYGLTHSESKGRLHKYLDKLYLKNPANNRDLRVYNHKVYIFIEERLITVLPLPHNLCELADIQLKKKREGNEQDKN